MNPWDAAVSPGGRVYHGKATNPSPIGALLLRSSMGWFRMVLHGWMMENDGKSLTTTTVGNKFQRINIQVVPGQAGGGSFTNERPIAQKTEGAYRMWIPPCALQKPSLDISILWHLTSSHIMSSRLSWSLWALFSTFLSSSHLMSSLLFSSLLSPSQLSWLFSADLNCSCSQLFFSASQLIWTVPLSNILAWMFFNVLRSRPSRF